MAGATALSTSMSQGVRFSARVNRNVCVRREVRIDSVATLYYLLFCLIALLPASCDYSPCGKALSHSPLPDSFYSMVLPAFAN